MGKQYYEKAYFISELLDTYKNDDDSSYYCIIGLFTQNFYNFLVFWQIQSRYSLLPFVMSKEITSGTS